MSTSSEFPVPGACGIDHAADIGIEVRAPDLATLFERAALATLWLTLEAPPPPETERRALRVSGEDLPSLLQRWLREILYWHEMDGFIPEVIEVSDVVEDASGRLRIEARVGGGRAGLHPVREIKGVTFHGLVVEPRGGDWLARVIFDV